MKIALDYDDTYTLDREFWMKFLMETARAGHDIRIVTARDERHDRTPPLAELENIVPVIYTRGVAKVFHCTHFADWLPDVWVDDSPQSIFENSPATPEWLKVWRAYRSE